MSPQPLRDRMFHVIVLGGIGLVGLDGCGKVNRGGAGDAGAVVDGGSPPSQLDAFPDETCSCGTDAFPSEGPVQVTPDAFPSETATELDAFPSEGPAQFDASPPLTGDATVDGTTDSSPPQTDAECFPDETAVALDAGRCSP